MSMDLVFKAKSYELEAIDFLNKNAPDIYQGKNKGFYWAMHEAYLNRKTTEFQNIAKIKIERYFSGAGYEDKAGIITHVTGDDKEFEALTTYLEEVFGLQRSIQKSFFIRTILKYGIYSLKGVDKIYSENTDDDSLDDFTRFNLAVEVSEMLFQNNKNDKKYIDDIYALMKRRR